jgi:hypothetical protein
MIACMLLLECIFLPFTYTGQRDPKLTNAGFHTLAGKQKNMKLDLEALVLELTGTIGAACFVIFWMKKKENNPDLPTDKTLKSIETAIKMALRDRFRVKVY